MGKPAHFTIERRYAWDADRHFAAISQYDELQEAMTGQARYDGLPSGQAYTGQVFEVKITLMGWLPIGRWRIEVLECDCAKRVLRSLERGGAVRAWRHTITVEPLADGGCLHRDALEIDAGWLTGLYARTARNMYEKRHELRSQKRNEAALTAA